MRRSVLFAFRLTRGADAIKVKLLTLQLITGTGFNFTRDFGSFEIMDIVHPTALRATNMRVVGHVCIITETVFPRVENLNQSDFMQDIDGLIYGGKTHRGISGLQTVENHFCIGVLLGIGQHLINCQALWCHLESISTQHFGNVFLHVALLYSKDECTISVTQKSLFFSFRFDCIISASACQDNCFQSPLRNRHHRIRLRIRKSTAVIIHTLTMVPPQNLIDR